MRPKRKHSAFSLAEMMIALALLAMGLLVIGAALPIGVRYTQQSANLANGQAAAKYALDLIEQNVCITHQIFASDEQTQIAAPMIFVPRALENDPDFPEFRRGQFIPDYEPIIKVRPLYVQQLNAWPGTPDNKLVIYDYFTGKQIRNLFPSDDSRECDYTQSSDDGAYLQPALPCFATLYPPVAGDSLSRTWHDFLPAESNMYQATPVGAHPGLLRKALDQRIGWTAFYRRVSYPPHEPGSTEAHEKPDPALYEFIVVVTQRPSLNHRYATQDVTNTMIHGIMGQNQHTSGTTTPGLNNNRSNKDLTLNIDYLPKYDCAAPVPWLVTFGGLPAPGPYQNPTNFDENGYPLPLGYRPATLSFMLRSADYDGLFPVGTIFIPARNDHYPDNPSPAIPGRPVGFGPPAPSTLPIYEVVERPSDVEVVVKFNGYYPREGDPDGSIHRTPPDPRSWPVWVIPPAFKEISFGEPVFDDESPILAVSRRYIRLRELP